MKTSEVIWDLFDLAVTGVAGVTRRVALMQQPTPESPPSADIAESMWSRLQAGKTYLRALFRLILYCSAFPLPILALGMVAELGWLVATVGIFWALCTLVLLMVATPIGLLVEGILGGIKGIGPRYVKFSLSIFLIELLFTLFASVVPIQNNPSAIPIVILASAILGVIGAMGVKTPLSQGFIASMVTLVFVIFTLSFFFPQTFKTVTDWGRRLDLEISRQFGRPTSSTNSYQLPSGVLKKDAEKRMASKIETRRQYNPSNATGNKTDPNPVRVRQISGTAYSYTQEHWAIAKSWSDNGRYPNPSLLFNSGLVYGIGRIKWNASYKLSPDRLILFVAKLSVDDCPILPEYYTDIGVGYDIQLENAVFSDYTIAKTLLLFRTFSGDSPPPKIEKNFDIIRVIQTSERPYLIDGEWKGSFIVPQSNKNFVSTNFIARFVQNGNRFEGVIIDFYIKKKDRASDIGGDQLPDRVRSRVEGLIVDDKITFVKTHKERPVGTSCVATFVKGVPSLEGQWHLFLDQGRWNMTRIGDFKGSPDDILSVGNPNL